MGHTTSSALGECIHQCKPQAVIVSVRNPYTWYPSAYRAAKESGWFAGVNFDFDNTTSSDKSGRDAPPSPHHVAFARRVLTSLQRFITFIANDEAFPHDWPLLAPAPLSGRRRPSGSQLSLTSVLHRTCGRHCHTFTVLHKESLECEWGALSAQLTLSMPPLPAAKQTGTGAAAGERAPRPTSVPKALLTAESLRLSREMADAIHRTDASVFAAYGYSPHWNESSGATHVDEQLQRQKRSARQQYPCRNLTGLWEPASPALAARYAGSAFVQGEVYDAVYQSFALLWRPTKPFDWQRNGSVPSLLVFRERPEGDHADEAAFLQTADHLDWGAVLRGRVVLFIGDSISGYQATNLLLLAADRRTTSIERVRRGFHPKSGESQFQTSWCSAVCSKVRGPWSATNRCSDAHTVICWLSAGKAASPSMRVRTIGLVATWAFAMVGRELTSRDVIVGNAAHHFHPHAEHLRSRQLRPFVEASRWHASARWRLHASGVPLQRAWHDGAPAGASAGATAGASAGASPWNASSALGDEHMPHVFYREASPQIWAGGVFPGRVGQTSHAHDCLPEWDWEAVQATHMFLPHSRRPAEYTLEHLLGPHAYDAYNQGVCQALEGSPVALLKIWLPSAILGARESYTPFDCTHNYMYGSHYPFWNQQLINEILRRERLRPPVSPKLDRKDTWDALHQMISQSNKGGLYDASRGHICGREGMGNTTYRPSGVVCEVYAEVDEADTSKVNE